MDGTEYARFTYTFSGSTVTVTTTEGFEGGNWKPYDSLSSDFKAHTPKTLSVIISGNTFTGNGVTFTKQ